MPLSAGSRLGHYEIVALLGAGGMGEVYRARDPRLEREVAIKVLAADGALEPGMLQRLQQEARTVAGLNHPNLLALFDMGEHQGAPFLVMELLDGETLRARLNRGPLGVRRSLDIARQVAQGLAAAHEAGIVHRDLKPENIFLTQDGRAKILDFGLAKVTATGDAAGLAEAATIVAAPASARTQPGMVLGTVGYMSPEQVRGEPATPRSDIFAFGAILYEMLSGARAFGSASSVEVMSAILRDEPPPVVAEGTPLAPALDRIVRRCLEKEPRLRFQTASDLDFALAALQDTSTSRLTAALNEPPRRRERRFRLGRAAAAALGLVIGAALVALFTLDRGGPDYTRMRLQPVVPSTEQGSGAHWSPDGTAIAYAARPAPQQPPQVFVRYLNSPTATQLTHVPNLDDIEGWSASGDHIYFDDQHHAWSVAVVGGTPQQLTGLDLGQNDQGLTGWNDNWAVLRPAGDGKFTVFTSSPGSRGWQRYQPAPFAATTVVNQPQLRFAPNGKAILLAMNSERGEEENWLLPYPASPSHPPHRVLRNLPAAGRAPTFSWMPDSRHLVAATQNDPNSNPQLWLVDTQSAAIEPLTFGVGASGLPAVSPDGGRLMFVHTSGEFNIVSVRLASAVAAPVLAEATNDDQPSWALRQPAMAYLTTRNGAAEIWLHTQASGGDTTERPLVTPAEFGPTAANRTLFMAPVLAANADRVMYCAVGSGAGNVRIMISSTRGGRPVPLVTTDNRLEVAPTWSPDGNSAVFIGVHGHTGDLLLASTAGNATAAVLRADISSMLPAWSPDGKWIAYQADDNTVHLLSPDGKTDRNLGALPTQAVAFAPDSRSLYGVESVPGHNYLFQVDLVGGGPRRVGDIGADFTPQSGSNPALRFTLTPDGQSLTYSTAHISQSLWMLTNFDPQPGVAARIRGWLHIP